MKVRRMGAALAGLVAMAAPAVAQEAAPDLYQRVERHLAANPELASRIGRPAPEMTQLGWMVGTWDVIAEVEGREPRDSDRGTSVVTPVFGGVWLEVRDTYPSGTQDVGYVGYSIAQRQWISLALDSLGNANRTVADGWRSNGIVFEGDVTILGLPAHLRQVIARVGDDEYTVRNDERVGGAWRTLDRYRYRRRR